MRLVPFLLLLTACSGPAPSMQDGGPGSDARPEERPYVECSGCTVLDRVPPQEPSCVAASMFVECEPGCEIGCVLFSTSAEEPAMPSPSGSTWACDEPGYRVACWREER